MINYYIEKDNQIIFFDTDLQRLQNTVALGEYSELEIKETERPIENFEFADTPEYIAEQAQKEAERIARLHLTRGDVFRGLLQAKGVTRTQLRAMIEAMPDGLDKEMALIDFDEALEFYRGVALVDTIGLALGITSNQMTKFFETNDFEELRKING